jgi:hypothetical protein
MASYRIEDCTATLTTGASIQIPAAVYQVSGEGPGYISVNLVHGARVITIMQDSFQLLKVTKKAVPFP